MDDDESEEAFFSNFEEMFGFGKGFDIDDFDDFTDMLGQDTKFMKQMFKGLGSNYRMGGGGGRRRKNQRGGGGPGNMEDLLTMFMMPGMMGMGMGPGKPQKKKNKKAKKASEDDGWDTEEEELD